MSEIITDLDAAGTCGTSLWRHLSAGSKPTRFKYEPSQANAAAVTEAMNAFSLALAAHIRMATKHPENWVEGADMEEMERMVKQLEIDGGKGSTMNDHKATLKSPIGAEPSGAADPFPGGVCPIPPSHGRGSPSNTRPSALVAGTGYPVPQYPPQQPLYGAPGAGY